MSCCPPRGYEKLFGERTARRDARRYRRKGLDETAERMVEFVRSRGLDGTTVLEIGGGVGAIEVELLKEGAERAVNVELSPYYEAAARELWDEQGVAARVEYRIANIAEDGKDVEPADTVLMHRVVCCYPDYDALVGAAAERTRRHLVMSFPRERVASRVVVRGINLVARLLRWEHRSYVHPVAAILAAAERRGLKPVFEHQGLIWRVAGLERSEGLPRTVGTIGLWPSSPTRSSTPAGCARTFPSSSAPCTGSRLPTSTPRTRRRSPGGCSMR